MPLLVGFSALGKAYGDHMVSPFFVLLFLLYSIGRNIEGRALYYVLAWAVVCAVIVAGDRRVRRPGEQLRVHGRLPSSSGRLCSGACCATARALNRTLHDKARRLQRERAQRTVAAAGEERTRIAGELHDVVAHALSAMVVQAAGARRLAERDPARAADAFHAVETSGREALDEIRRLLGVLRREDEDVALAPQPSLRHVSSLLRRIEAAGLPVELAVEGEERDLPLGLDLTAYRVLQEALGSALEDGHAAHARVRLNYGDAHIEVEVIDDGGDAVAAAARDPRACGARRRRAASRRAPRRRARRTRATPARRNGVRRWFRRLQRADRHVVDRWIAVAFVIVRRGGAAPRSGTAAAR